MPGSRRHYRVTLQDALEAHETALESGGLLGVLNQGLIESAIARPYDGHYPRIHQKAAALLESVAQNHAFADGNKRTALYLVDLLIGLSGYRLVGESREELNEEMEELVTSVAQRLVRYQELVDWFRARIQPQQGNR